MRARGHGKRWRAWAVPALLATIAPFVAVSTCGKTENVRQLQTQSSAAAAADIEALCKDWLYYRKKVIQYTVAGERQKAERARARFRQVNSMLSAFPESSVNAAFLRLEEDGYKP